MRIFFREPDGEWTKSYTEAEVQKWYREKWFTNQFEFIITDNDEKPASDAVGVTLSELKKHNGVCCAFLSLDPITNTSIIMENKLVELEKKLNGLLDECDEKLTLEARVAAIERSIEELSKLSEEMADETNIEGSSKPTVEEVPQVAAADKIQYGKYADLVVQVLTAMEIDKFDAVPEINKQMASAVKEIKTKKQKEELLKVVLEKIKEREFSLCRKCDMLLQKPKHAVLHLVDPNRPEAHQKVKSLNEFCDLLEGILLENVRGWVLAEKAVFEEEMQRYSNIHPNRPDVVPTFPIVMEMLQKHTERVFYGFPDNHVDAIRKVYARMEKIAPEFLKDYKKLLGSKMTRCASCSHVTGTLENYFKHITTYSHISFFRGSSYQEPSTFFVNYLRRNED